MQWKSYIFESSQSNDGDRDWLDVEITEVGASRSVSARVMHVIDAKVWRRELLKFKCGDIDCVEIFKLGSDFSIKLDRKDGEVHCIVHLNPDPLLENYSDIIDFGNGDIDSLVGFVDNFIYEYEALIK